MIDLSTIPIGTQCKTREGKTVTLLDNKGTVWPSYPFDFDDEYSRNAKGEIYENTDYKRDIVEILPIKTSNKIDLFTLVPGQRVKLKSGIVLEFVCKSKDSNDYPYKFKHITGSCSESYTQDGFYYQTKEDSEWNIIEILPAMNAPTTHTPEHWKSVLPFIQALAEGKEVECKDDDGNWTELDQHIHFNLPVSHYRIAAAKQEIPLDQADWLEGGPWWIRAREADTAWCMVVTVTPDKIFWINENIHDGANDKDWLEHKHTAGLERSNDGINWHKCSKLKD